MTKPTCGDKCGWQKDDEGNYFLDILDSDGRMIRQIYWDGNDWSNCPRCGQKAEEV
jgi:hypothetical protein